MMVDYWVHASPGQLWLLFILAIMVGANLGTVFGVMIGNATTPTEGRFHNLTVAQQIMCFFCGVVALLLLFVVAVYITTQGWVLNAPAKG
jgi:hypothetical protein